MSADRLRPLWDFADVDATQLRLRAARREKRELQSRIRDAAAI